jgi:hypothetical protein
MELKSSILEFNDCTGIQFMDASGILFAIKRGGIWYESNDGWFVDEMSPTDYPLNKRYYVGDIKDGGLVLSLEVRIETTKAKYNNLKKINLHQLSFDHKFFNQESDMYTDPSQLVWSLYPIDFELDWKKWPDGLYTITYSLHDGDGQLISHSNSVVFMSGQCRNKVYRTLAKLPIEKDNVDLVENNFNDVLYGYTLLRALENSNYVAQVPDLIKGLKTLQKFLEITKCFNCNND